MTIRALILKKAKVLAFFLPLLLMHACIEEYEIEVMEGYENAIVIDGKITNLPGPYTITISNSTSIAEPEFSPVRRAKVMIVDDIGNSEILSEIREGIYQTSETGIQGTIGRSYKLIIQTKEGKNYESGFEELLAPVAIESLTAQLESRFAPNLNPIDLNDDYEYGFQFYVSTATSEKTNNFYYWELEETWEIRSAYKIDQIFYPQGKTSAADKIYIPGSPDTLYYCWKSKNDKLYTSNTAHLNSPKITNLPLNFVPIQSEMINIKYSLLLKQFTISENTYIYFNALLNQEDGLEGLYTKQPYQISGNVINVDNVDETVLGYFIVTSTSTEARLTVPRPTEIRVRWHMPCDIEDFNVLKDEALLNYMFQGTGPYLLAEYEFFDANTNKFEKYLFLPPTECIDCTSRGGVTKKPDYWDQ